ncbi:MAG: DNA-binding protein [Verrucomicrobia bacterium]|nr:DNA-binding protein [Verrucomicrobiota bacterium]MBU4290035.1 DNA-binding protein [Verrucomicrobiota bacterium]MBU4428074.1 DNA-binding protein [Verrucomicrobiota bacterium]MCG2679595.1 DNA-binding protein [Kiritimatiellia bacterium]
MQIAEGHIQRVFVVRLEDGEQLPQAVETVAREKAIHSGLVLLIGGARNGTLVVGPETTIPKPVPMTRIFADGHELLGVGTLFEGANGPELHMHAALGRGDTARTGCIREGIVTYLIGEIVILELTGFSARRERDSVSGFDLLNLKD